MTSVNIAKDNVAGKCDLKCAYNYKYNSTNLVATNKYTYVQLDCDKDNVPPVTYNNSKYKVSGIKLYAPSIQLYNGNRVDAELVISHSPETGNSLLNVCIPFVQSRDSSSSSILMQNVIQGVTLGAPANSEKTNINLANFTLQDIVPRKPFYSYTGGNSDNYIAFDSLYAIPISQSTLAGLKKIITQSTATVTASSLYYNDKGPNSNLANEGIYISCNPTGSSKETVDVETRTKNPVVNDLATTMNDPVVSAIFQIILSLFVFVVLYFGFNFLYDKFFIKRSSSTLSTFGKG